MAQLDTPTLECNLVMKGGIASGLVYPEAVAELSRRYRFRGIAGTSAGAIAAVVSAAAEFARSQGIRCTYDGKVMAPFERIAALPSELGLGSRRSKLSRLFQAQPGTARYFNAALKGLRGGLLPIAFFAIGICARALLLTGLVALLIGWAVGGALGIAVAVAFALACSIAAALYSVRNAVRDLTRAIPENFYGLCTGRTVGGHDTPGLTDWLHELIQSLAGRAANARPLTMGDLWLLDKYDPGRTSRITPPQDPAVDLQLMTSNITQGRSHRFPNLIDWSGSLYFRKDELERLFPQSVVDWMVEKGRYSQTFSDEMQLTVPDGYFHLPWPEHLPVLFGARMSLSFPFLLSAIPLYVFDLSVLRDIERAAVPREHEAHLSSLLKGGLEDPAARARWEDYWAAQLEKVPLKRCWFSDGGVTSNFPIHFFDEPIARRPTFAINLTTPRTTIVDIGVRDSLGSPPAAPADDNAARDKGWNYIFMPSTNEDGGAYTVRFNDFERGDGKLLGFFSALFDTSRNWADNEQLFMPSYRDRIVHVMLEPHEGGLNLEMPPAVIDAVAQRGRLAAKLLLARFDPQSEECDPQSGQPVSLTWNNHRWVRYRTFMAALEQLLVQFGEAWTEESQHPERLPPGVIALPELLKQARRELMWQPGASCLTDYWWRNDAQMQHAQEVSEALARMARSWTGPDQSFDAQPPPEHSAPPSRICGRSPLPKPRLRVTPSYELIMSWGVPFDELPKDVAR